MMNKPVHVSHDLCRLCAGRSDQIKIFSDDDNNGVSLAYKINNTLNIKVQKTDDRISICNICKGKVEDYYDFKSMCRNTEAQGIGLKKDQDFTAVKIKEEPVEENGSSNHKGLPPNLMKMMQMHPFGAGFQNSTPLMFPTTYYMLDGKGDFVPCQLPMVPLGNPIPLSSLATSGLPMLGSLPSSNTSPKVISLDSEDRTSPKSKDNSENVRVKKERIEDYFKKSASGVKEAATSSKQILESDNDRSSSNSQADSESSDDLTPVDDIINEVLTDKEDDNSKSSAEDAIGGTGEKGDKARASLKTKSKQDADEDRPVDGEKQQSETSDADVPNSSELTTRETETARGRRGKKRRTSNLANADFSKRRRSARVQDTPKHPDEEKDEESSAKRLTRSSTGSRPKQRRIIVDSDDSDAGNFGVDDPDDPDDPEFSTKHLRRELSSSPSSSSSDSEKKEKTEPEKKKETPLLSAILKSSRLEKEEALKKSCPHCKLTYKHWVSFDDHVKICEEKHIEIEKLAKASSPVEKKKHEGDDLREVKCIVCLKKFVGTNALKTHMTVHQPKKGPPYECKTCKETFVDKGGLICHNALKHRSNVTEPILKSERKKLHCVPCDEHFQNSGDYICHQVLHHKKK